MYSVFSIHYWATKQRWKEFSIWMKNIIKSFVLDVQNEKVKICFPATTVFFCLEHPSIDWIGSARMKK
jgi:hypothetical protein